MGRMRSLAMYQVDAFADHVFGGNPAAVLVLDEWLTDAMMQNIAAENNLAETAFVRASAAGWDLRWFTPLHEVDFCGHATLATAHVLATERRVQGELVFATRVGELRVSRQEDGYTLDVPSLPPRPIDDLPSALSTMFPNAGATLFRNFENIFVELSGERAVREFVPDLAKIATLHPLGLAVTGKGDHYDFVSRYFAPGARIPEDPVTGSTHATLVPYWAKKLGKLSLSAFQCSHRGGHLGCELRGDRVHLTGRAATFMKAEILFPA
jgi:PhzF family phenazine biosynthesis protein